MQDTAGRVQIPVCRVASANFDSRLSLPTDQIEATICGTYAIQHHPVEIGSMACPAAQKPVMPGRIELFRRRNSQITGDLIFVGLLSA